MTKLNLKKKKLGKKNKVKFQSLSNKYIFIVIYFKKLFQTVQFVSCWWHLWRILFVVIHTEDNNLSLFLYLAMGPILPQINVFGKKLGISPDVMGFITSILPILYVLAKPAVGYLIDYFPVSGV